MTPTVAEIIEQYAVQYNRTMDTLDAAVPNTRDIEGRCVQLAQAESMVLVAIAIQSLRAELREAIQGLIDALPTTP